MHAAAKLTVALDDMPTNVDVLLHNCLRLKPPAFRFQYTVGPRPAAFKVQVFKSGAPGGLGYGVRTLENIRKGDFVCTYWGTRENRDGYRSPTRNYEYTIIVQLMRREGECASTVSRWGEEIGVNAMVIGNVGRWINCSRDAPTLEARMIHIKGCDHPVIAFFATKDIQCGQDLTWSYSSQWPGSSTDSAGAKDNLYYCLKKTYVDEPSQVGKEMVREASTGNQLVATWAFGNPPLSQAGRQRNRGHKSWQTFRENVSIDTGGGGGGSAVDEEGGDDASGTHMPLKGPWPKKAPTAGEFTDESGEYTVYEEYWEPYPVFTA